LGYVQKNPTLRLISPKRESTTPRVLTEGEYEQLQEAVGPKDLKTTSLYVGLAREQMNKEMQENAL
jgi:site-specific recombinase XerD